VNGSTRFTRGEQHIFRSDAASAAIGGVKIPVGGAQIVGGREAEGFCCFVDCVRWTFEFEDEADGSFVEVEMQRAAGKAGAEFFVAEGGAEAQGVEALDEFLGFAQREFAFGALFVARGLFGFASRRHGRRGFRCKDRASAACGLIGCCGRSFLAHADQSAAAAECSVGSIEQRVLFQDATVRGGGKAAEFGENVFEIRNAELNFDFSRNFINFAHASV
jgi:hypothetical protein